MPAVQGCGQGMGTNAGLLFAPGTGTARGRSPKNLDWELSNRLLWLEGRCGGWDSGEMEV